MLEVKNCPVCGSSNYDQFIKCKDYTVSQEYFNIVSCSVCGFKFTNPRPGDLEIGNYYKSENYVSHSNTKKGIINKLYHVVRKKTLKEKLHLIEKYVSRGTILDYGCGTGMFLKACKDSGWRSYGFEPDRDAKKIASKSATVFSDKREIKDTIGNEKLDIISLWHVLEHVTDLGPTLSFFRDSISESGRLIIAVPNHTSYDAQYYKQYWAGYDVPRHIYHFSPDTITRLLSNYGFKLTEALPMRFDSYYVSMLSEKYKTGRINYFKAFISGFRSNQRAETPSQYSSVIYVFKKA